MAEIVEIRRDNPNTRYEQSDWPISWVGYVYIGTFAILVIVPFILMWAFSGAVSDASRRLLVTPPAPALQIDPATDLARLRARENAALNTYHWVDKAKGVVHIPIRQAMEKLAASGIAGFPREKP